MTVHEVSILIKNELKNLYPPREITGITDIVFRHLLNINKSGQILQGNKVISVEPQIYNIIEQLKSNKPVQYIFGETEFYGFTFFVNESVLIPRPETEELVHWIYNDYRNSMPRIIDIGTGSACIAISLAKLLAGAKVYASDISDGALELAQKNAIHNKVKVHLEKFDILSDHMPDLECFDVIVSNPPYVTLNKKQSIDKNVLDYEPHLALFVPENGPLVFYKAIGRFAQKKLNKNGTLYFEINEEFPDETASCLEKLGFLCEVKKDLNDKFRMLKAKFR
jgi:release factor glutamine methyltransferase